MVLLQFVPFASIVQPAFWHKLSDVKIDTLKLSDDAIDISATYSVGRSVTDRETGTTIDLGCTISVGPESFDKDTKPHPGNVLAKGILKNFNTIEDFKSADKNAIFNIHAQKIWDHILSTRDSSLLNSFFLISFADLKKYKYYYWFAFPAFVAKPAWNFSNDWSPASHHFSPDTVCFPLSSPSTYSYLSVDSHPLCSSLPVLYSTLFPRPQLTDRPRRGL